MKKLLFTAVFLTGFAFLAPNVQAGHTERVFAGYDRCGRPVYRYVQRSSHYCLPRSYPYHYHSPTRYKSYSYGRLYDYGRSHQSRCRDSRPGFSIRLGF